MRFKGFIGPSYKLTSSNVDCQRTINLYPELNELGTGKEQEVAAIYGTPGLRTLLDLTIGPIRCEYTATNGQFYAVAKNKLYKISSAWVATELGTISTILGPVSMKDNGFQLVIVDGTVNGFYVSLTTDAFAALVFPEQVDGIDFKGTDMVDFLDGRFVFNHTGTQAFFISQLNDITFDILEFATVEGSPDNIVGLIVSYRELWLMGTQSIEVWFNSGDAEFPFSRISGAFIEHGCAAKFSIAKLDNAVFWLGLDTNGQGVVYLGQAYQPRKISTQAVDLAIQSYGDISDATAFTYQDRGHSFYQLNFPTANATWVYDAQTSLWHERAYTQNGVLGRHRADNHAFAYGKHVVGDYENGKIYELSEDVFTDDGQLITRKRISPHVTGGLRRMFYNSFQLDIESGVGLDGVGQGTNPKAMLTFSDDGGHSWSNEKWADLGKIGQRKARAIWRRLGASRDRVFSVTITDPVKVVLIGAELDVMQGGL